MVAILRRLFAQHGFPNGLIQRYFQILKINRLGDKIERAAVQRRADIRHIAVSGGDHRTQQRMFLANPRKQGQAVHHRHINVGEHHVETRIGLELRQGLLAIARELEGELRRANPFTEALRDQGFQIRFIINN